jgi:hypothetical protein
MVNVIKFRHRNSDVEELQAVDDNQHEQEVSTEE